MALAMLAVKLYDIIDAVINSFLFFLLCPRHRPVHIDLVSDLQQRQNAYSAYHTLLRPRHPDPTRI